MSYLKQMQKIVNEYRKDRQPWPVDKRSIAAWAVRTGHWQPQPGALVSQCADELGRAMREEYFTDPQGRKVRAKHAAKFFKEGKQMTLWGDIRSEDRKFMFTAFSGRRQQILGECHQLKIDVDSYNQNRNSSEPIQVVFDFTTDLEELDGDEIQKSAA